jgi:signal transduction histidine kinase
MRRWGHRRLQQQLFRWLALSILSTVVVVALVLHLVQPGTSPFSNRLQQVSAFAATQFADRWDDRAGLEAFAGDVAAAFGATLWLTDAGGHPIVVAGPADCRGWQQSLDVRRGEVLLGQVRACLHRANFGAATLLLVLAAVCLVLWTAAALVARRITRPLSLLIGATREIGAGNLSARVRLGRHQGGELGLLAEAVNDMAQRIERQMRDQRELLAAVSHEVRSPLARLRMCAELLASDGHNATALGALEREVEDLDALVGKLLASSRLDFETLIKQRVVAGDLCREVFDRRRLEPSTLEDESRGQKADLDPTLIVRALDNLLDNAVRHGGGVTRCVLRVAEPRERDPVAARASLGRAMLVFEVCDQGPGFDASALPRVFDAFYQGRARRPEQGSLGLGLALVQRIAVAHGGQAWAENVEAGGARVAFSVALPEPPVISRA